MEKQLNAKELEALHVEKFPRKAHHNVLTRRSIIVSTLPSLTEQSHKRSCDINDLVARVLKGGTLDPNHNRSVSYVDFTNIPDYFTQLNRNAEITSQAYEIFNDLPAQVRKEFDNDASVFFQMAANKDNIPKLKRLGLVVEKTPPAAPETPQAPDSNNDIPVVNPQQTDTKD